MTRPRLLDLFCGAGGASMGYHRAGFDVVGVDNDATALKRYPFMRERADALDILRDPSWLREFDVIHASPPCQAYTGVPNRRDDHPDLVGPVRDALRSWGGVYVIENVPGAPMPDGFVLCGSTFGLPVIRHRVFETNGDIGLVPSTCPQGSWGRAAGDHPGTYPYASGSWEKAWREHVVPAVWPWMTLEDAGQAIPPDYTEWIGGQLIDLLAVLSAL